MSKRRRALSESEFLEKPQRRLKQFETDGFEDPISPSSNGGELVLSRASASQRNEMTPTSSASHEIQSPGALNRSHRPIAISNPSHFIIKDSTFISIGSDSDGKTLPFVDSPEGKKIRKALVKNLDFGPLPDKCLPGTRVTILNEVDARIHESGDHNIIWIRGFPGVGKSALASTIISRLHERGQLLSYFVFDRGRPTVTTTRALWGRVAWDFARLFPLTRQSLLRRIDDEPVGINIAGIAPLFSALIEEPLSHLPDDMFGPNRPRLVVVIDGVDECGGLDGSRSKDRKELLMTLELWQSKIPNNIKLVVTSREDDDFKRRLLPISSIIDFSIATDEAVRDIHALLIVRLEEIAEPYSELLPTDWVDQTAKYLSQRAGGVFVWATTVANFIECGEPQSQLDDIRSGSGFGLGGEGGSLFSLYARLLRTSFKDMRENQREAFKSVVRAMIFAERPLDDAEYTSSSPVVSTTMLQYIRIGLRSVIAQGPILRFSHQSFCRFPPLARLSR
ncbi:hypothetical protein NP233_g870 [Leucocoprinus birnbaumii]|uniref:Nephrocystin 3-like N-terminal domain-containing protein n=1 Tax=Leucocoprinus birnbaumii TaxID=56174 RepID=A0AAD5W125_9AGAR|nr:hypothetical protein NP233_g870 [Leucocoprinus birnbaumii]